MREISSIYQDYQPSDLDEGTTSYFGFITKAGDWIIKEVTATTIRYARGDSNSSYIDNWNNHTNLTYKYFNEIF